VTGTRVARVLLGLAAVAAALAVWAFLTGGFRIHLFGIPLSARGEHRAALIALTLAVIGFFLHKPLQHRAASALAHFPLRRIPVLLVASGAAAVLGLGIAYGSRATGGSDVYGYVSQAELWRRGDLHIAQDFVASMSWPDADWTFTPLGYRPHHSVEHVMVPTYPPGLPLLMLAFSVVLGASAPYLVAPVCGALLVLLTYALGARVSNPVVGAIAALCVAVCPAVLFILMLPMSDVPVATFWTASLLFACGFRDPAAGTSRDRRTLAAVLSGIAAGVAIVIRPNLVPLAIAPFLLCALVGRGWGAARAAAARPALFALACAPFVLFVGWLFNHLYGSPLRSGYGDNAALFGWGYFASNIVKYPAWIWETQGPFIFLFPLSAVFARRSGLAVRLLLLLFVAMILGCYLFYLSFDAWWYLRFLLPAFPVMFILAADAVWNAAERFGRPVRNAAIALFALGAVGYPAMDALQRDILAVGRGERKYADVGRYTQRMLPPNAIVITMQHSGTVRHYAGRVTMRYDYLMPDWLDRAVAHLVRIGYEPYLLLDDWEVPIFREKFASQALVAFAEEPPHRPCTHATYIFRLRMNDVGSRWSERVPQLSGCQ
jgi:hypothetical protein